MKKINNNQIRILLKDLSAGWQVKNEKLKKNYHFRDYNAARRFVGNVARIAKELDHHPEICFGYNEVKVETRSHDVGGLSSRDFRLAKEIDALNE